MLSGVPGLATAQTPPVRPPDPEAAYQAAFQAMFADPGNLDKAFTFAMSAIQVNDLEGAIATLERMLLIDSDLPRVRLELGVLYFRLGSYDAAYNYLTSAREAPDLPPVVRERIEKFLAEIEDRTSRHRFSGSVYAGLKYQTNANTGPSDPQIKFLGFDATLSDSSTEQPDVDQFFAAQLQYAYDLGTVPSRWLEVDLNLYGSNQATQDQLDTRLAHLKVGPRFAPMPETFSDLVIRPFVSGEYIGLADRAYYSAYGGGVEVEVPYDDRLAFDGEATIYDRTYYDTASNPTNSLLDGPRSTVRANARYALAPNTAVILSASVLREETRTGGENNWAYELGGTVQQVVPSPVDDFLPAPWILSLSLSGIHSEYDAPNDTIDPTVTREDDKWRAVFVTSVPVRADTAVVLTLSYTDVDSNLPNFTYSNLSAALGAVFRF